MYTTYMQYINDPKLQPYMLYDDVVRFVINHGIEPKRAYIFLAALGVKSDNARILEGMSYLPVVKIAIKNNRLVSSVATCDHCDGFAFTTVE